MGARKDLAGKVAIVTGAGRNIGREIAIGLAEDGAAVVVNVRSNREEAAQVVRTIEAAGGKAIALSADVADPEAVKRMVDETVRNFGRIDILVNNAAVRREKAFWQMTLMEWREVMSATLDGAFICASAVLPHLDKAGGGSIVNIGGVSAHTGAKARAHVVAAKMGIVGLTRALAHDLAEAGITVNCVVPGLIDTSRDPAGTLPSHHAVNKTLVGRLGKSEEIAAAVRYLCSSGARYVTGQVLHANGGIYFGN